MRVLVTGAGGPIGRATVEQLTARGHQVVASGRRLSSLDGLEGVQRVALDVGDADSVAAALAEAGELDAIVNNAGLTGSGPLEGFPPERLALVMDTNALAPLRLAQAVLPEWRERGSGVLVNLSSVQGRIAPPLEGVYAASKHALEALSETLYYEVAHFGIRVVIMEPGYIAPGMRHDADHRGPAVYDQLHTQMGNLAARVTGPAGRTPPQVVAEAIARAIEDPTTAALRVVVGDDAALILSLRTQLDDAGFEAAMRAALDLTW